MESKTKTATTRKMKEHPITTAAYARMGKCLAGIRYVPESEMIKLEACKVSNSSSTDFLDCLIPYAREDAYIQVHEQHDMIPSKEIGVIMAVLMDLTNDTHAEAKSAECEDTLDRANAYLSAYDALSSLFA